MTVDFYLPEEQAVIEVQGSWYHGDPTIYWVGELNAMQRRKRAQDAALARYCERAHLRLCEVWEDDIRHRPGAAAAWLRVGLGRPPEEAIMAEVKRRVALPGGVALCVCHGDLTTEQVDAIVNAANGNLAHGGGVAAAIVRRGGQTIQEESRRRIAAQGPLATGEAVATGAGALGAKAVIHAVGPVWQGGGQHEPELLRAAVFNSLRLADEAGYQTIAMPAISSGIFGFPKGPCAEILLDEAVRFCAQRPDTSLREIRFTNFDAPTVGVFETAFRARFGEPAG